MTVQPRPGPYCILYSNVELVGLQRRAQLHSLHGKGLYLWPLDPQTALYGLLDPETMLFVVLGSRNYRETAIIQLL